MTKMPEVGPLAEMDIFLPIKPKRVSEEIVRQIRSLIFEGKLQPGQRLPPERELAKSLNVSRVSLREALNTLQGMGLIEIQQGNRTFVRPITTRSIYDPLVSFGKSDYYNIIKFLEVRKYLEVGSASLAAQRATSEEIEQCEKILEEMKEDLKRDRLGAKSDFDFHSAIVRATHNLAYIHLMQTIYDLLQEELRIAYGDIFRKKDKRKKLLLQHQNMFEAIREHDPERASKEALIHLSFASETWESGLIKKKR
jgi:GntR family transcriptional repressor for pyruvate dehydrogenase complex